MDKIDQIVGRIDGPEAHRMKAPVSVALLTGGGDRPYAFGLSTALVANRAFLDLIASDELDCPEIRDNHAINFLNLRGDQRTDASVVRKMFRVLIYYARLVRYAATAKPRLFHILWNNKFEAFDRTLLMLYYRLLKKKVVLTLHNINAGNRDSEDTLLNRATLRIQYKLADHIFVHTNRMKRELMEDFQIPPTRITVIPFGINNSVPSTELTSEDARQQLGIRQDERTILFFGNIAPYKGVEYLIAALREVSACRKDYRLIIAGRPKNCEPYWSAIRDAVSEESLKKLVLLRAEFIPEEETEIYFKASDVLVLPYRHIYQSGVLFLGYSFGLPALVSDVGSLKDEIVDGRTGFAFKPENSADLAKCIDRYFESELFADLEKRRGEIRAYAMERYSWNGIARTTINKYADLLKLPAPAALNRGSATACVDSNSPASNDLT